MPTKSFRVKMRVRGKTSDSYTIIQAATAADAEKQARRLFKLDYIIKTEVA
mgnify:CR=1 FL=1